MLWWDPVLVGKQACGYSTVIIKFNNDYLHPVNFLTRLVRFLHRGYFLLLLVLKHILSASLLKGKDCVNGSRASNGVEQTLHRNGVLIPPMNSTIDIFSESTMQPVSTFSPALSSFFCQGSSRVYKCQSVSFYFLHNEPFTAKESTT
jgi:hypothetical protein